MRHRRTVPKLGRTASHRKAMLRNMVTSLLREERVQTTVAKAKECRRVAERVITTAKRGDLHARRRAARVVRDRDVLQKLFEEIAPRFAERPGGYTRILKTGFRQGDDAPLSILELVDAALPAAAEAEDEEAPKARRGRKKAGVQAEGKSAAGKTAAKKKARTKKVAKKEAVRG